MITPNIIERSWIQGATVAVEYLTGTAFSGENGAHTFKIRGVDVDGQPVAISGSVLAKILRADNVTVDVAGSVVDGIAEVTMVGDCYHVPGRASIVIFLSDGTNTVTLYAAVFNVYRSTSGNEIDSGVSIPSLAELLAQIERMETATAAAEAVVDEIEPRVEKLESTVLTDETATMNQQVPNGNFESTAGWQKGATAHTLVAENNEITLTVTSTAVRSRIYRSDIGIIGGHKFYVYAELKASEDERYLYLVFGAINITKTGYAANTWITLDGLVSPEADGTTITLAYGDASSSRLPAGGTLSARNVFAVDLTLMFGAGNEPQSAEEFREMFKADYYPYDADGTEIKLTALDLMNRQIGRLKHAVNQLQPSGSPLLMSAPRVSMPQMTVGGGEADEGGEA